MTPTDPTSTPTDPRDVFFDYVPSSATSLLTRWPHTTPTPDDMKNNSRRTTQVYVFLVKNFEECLEDSIKLKMSLFLKNRKTFRLTLIEEALLTGSLCKPPSPPGPLLISSIRPAHCAPEARPHQGDEQAQLTVGAHCPTLEGPDPGSGPGFIFFGYQVFSECVPSSATSLLTRRPPSRQDYTHTTKKLIDKKTFAFGRRFAWRRHPNWHLCSTPSNDFFCPRHSWVELKRLAIEKSLKSQGGHSAFLWLCSDDGWRKKTVLGFWWKTQDWWKKTGFFDDWGNWDILDCDEVGLETLGSWDSIWLCLVVEGTFCGHWLHKRRVVPFRHFLFCFHPLSPSDFVTLTATPSIDKVGCNPRSGFVFSNTPLSLKRVLR